MRERETRSMQRLSAKDERALAAVGGIAYERVAERRKVDANLMRAPRLQPASEQRRDAEPLDDIEVRACGFSRRDHRHRRTASRVASDRCVDRAARGDVA